MLLLPGNPGGHLGRAGLDAHGDVIGWLITPRRPMLRAAQTLFRRYAWAADNECYSLDERFDFDRYKRFLLRTREYPGRCLFVTVPDFVGDAKVTAQYWTEFAPRMRMPGLPLAYVAQDGLTELPDEDFDCLFIGGTTRYKLSPTVAHLARQAKARGLWVHMGRVNSIVRMQHAHRIGVDSVDGTGWAKNPQRHIRWALALLRSQLAQLTYEGI